jgi:histidyl-tRNA synthetase
MIGPDERARGVVRIKDLATEAQRDEPLATLDEVIS